MRTTFNIGNQEVNGFYSAVTPIIFRQVFKRDFLRENNAISAKLVKRTKKLKKLANVQKDLAVQNGETAVDKDELIDMINETMNEDDYIVLADQEELGQMLLFIMIKQEELRDLGLLSKLTQDDYLSFLNSYDYQDLAAAGRTALLKWNKDARAKVERKNLQSRAPGN